MVLEGQVEIKARDIFKKGFEEFGDCYQGTQRSPTMFTGIKDANVFVLGALDLIIRRSLFLLDNRPVKVKIIVEPL